MNRLTSRLGLNRSPKPPTFKEWSDTTTPDDVLNLFTTLIKSGTNDGQSSAFTPQQLASLEHLLSTLPTNAAGQIDINAIQSHLSTHHPSLRAHINAASSTISLLLHAHASFPFAEEVPLTKDALIRAIALLTQSSDSMWAQSADVGQQPAIRTRSRTARMEFIFSALARPETRMGVPTKEDVLDVLCRVRYPAPSSASYSQRRPISELEPLAERLLTPSLPSRDELCVSVAEFRGLAGVCYAMRDDGGVEAEKLLASKESLNRDEFKQWAKAASLPMCLHKLFCIPYLYPQ
ncbi:hypothetical protein BU23DRAFT_598278 [Bimuria novae-zelandiae CBS 107.79]|uniref:Uncharacterized protein n=1 Tax=Bimuria novae-zelandiae CBS 107.79 TaxID=1447943 RepID=A0A6A5VBS6_9PLEO|nr:hypothetical protein BU23DRAFT_598278 [Bimuria novae-zelandiae CBS 107.79]